MLENILQIKRNTTLLKEKEKYSQSIMKLQALNETMTQAQVLDG